MKRGFPRPMIEWPELKSDKFSDKWQEWWRHKTRRLPIPYSAQEDNLSQLHGGRVKDCTSFRNCIVCGDWCPDDEVWAYKNGSNGWIQDSGPFHEKCVRLTMKMCPMVQCRPDSYLFEKVSWAEVGPLIRGKRS